MKNSSKKKRNSDEQFTAITPLNFAQRLYLDSIYKNTIVFGIGAAGTGKTFLPTNYAAGELFYKNINKIVLITPTVETGKSLGATPGELDEKFKPYIEPFEETLKESLGLGFYDYSLKARTIDPKPLNYLKGTTFRNCIVLADEMQNATVPQFKMLLSRIGENCKMILTGDSNQADIHNSGLMDAVHRLSGIDNIDVVTFLEDDIVRSDICKSIIKAYNN